MLAHIDINDHRLRSKKAFTILEVMIASGVMIFAISTSLIVIQHALRTIDTARYTTLAGQILQSQVEKLRMLTWTQLNDTTYGPTKSSNFYFTPDVLSSSSTQINRFDAGGGAGTFSQSITSAPSPFDTQMKIIVLTAKWKGSDGRSHTLVYSTRYLKYGLSDIFYTSR